jgi:hypothetical protein
VNLAEALNEFDAAETTLRRLEEVWDRMSDLVPEGITFEMDSPRGIEYEELRRAFEDLVDGLPRIDGWQIEASPMGLNEIAQNRFDAKEIEMLEAIVDVEEGIVAPGAAIRDYRFRFDRARRKLIRRRVQELVGQVEALLPTLVARIGRSNEEITDPDWSHLVASIGEIERLMGSSMRRTGRWNDFARHIAFAQGVDLHDIATLDWPSVSIDIQHGLFGEHEPVPVQVEDLGELAETRPSGAVTAKLAWDRLDDESFERIIFNIIGDAEGYENPLWLTHTNAPDRSRDLSVERVIADSLGGVNRQRVIVQCKHWLSRPIGPSQVADAVNLMSLWEPPPVDVLVLATSGRFSADAVSWIEKHNEARKRPSIEPWAETRLESFLAQRPHLVTEFGLRSVQ